jgi:hypothetical protein
MTLMSDNDYFLAALREGRLKFSELTITQQGIVLLRAQELKLAAGECTPESFL